MSEVVESCIAISEVRYMDTGVEALYCGALQRPAPYYAKVLKPISNGPGYWNSLRIGIFEREPANIQVEGYSKPKCSDSDKQIGEYLRNYSSEMRTFHPFQLRGKWYALYSKDYTATRIMELPSCQDIGGEEKDSWGFCPVDYWVPPLHYIESVCNDGCPRDKKNGRTPDYTKACTCTIVHNPETCPTVNKTLWEKIAGASRSCTCKKEWEEFNKKHHVWHFPDRVHGFVAGCIWGDDTSWKIQYLDLSQADKGIIKREDRFGYIAMPGACTLEEAVNLDAGDDYMSLRIATESYYDLTTGFNEDQENEKQEIGKRLRSLRGEMVSLHTAGELSQQRYDKWTTQINDLLKGLCIKLEE